jgi:hypothetical protein
MATMKEMVDAVVKHADAHWGEDGWDEISEGYERSEIEEILVREKITTIPAAIAELHELAKLLKERGDDIRATAW